MRSLLFFPFVHFSPENKLKIESLLKAPTFESQSSVREQLPEKPGFVHIVDVIWRELAQFCPKNLLLPITQRSHIYFSCFALIRFEEDSMALLEICHPSFTCFKADDVKKGRDFLCFFLKITDEPLQTKIPMNTYLHQFTAQWKILSPDLLDPDNECFFHALMHPRLDSNSLCTAALFYCFQD
jgi:hypothetical protein